MSTQKLERSTRLYSKLENEVFCALRGLPSGCAVHIAPEAFTYEIGGIPDRYEPGMAVSAPDGRRLFVEVKSRYAMSWSNMARLLSIQRRAESDGAQFLVIVPDAIEPANKSMLFDELHVAYGQGTANVVAAVVDALNSQPPNVGADADAPHGAPVDTVGRSRFAKNVLCHRRTARHD